ncbi:MAG: hypothetical protein ACYDC6_12235 [Acidobacteriaceae bacterium]
MEDTQPRGPELSRQEHTPLSRQEHTPLSRQEHTPVWLGTFFAVLTAAYALLLVRDPSPFFADDSFFYLQVGRNFALGHGSTFNRLMPTNGYHPVWMLLCAAVYRIVPGRVAGLHGVAVLIVLLNLIVLMAVTRLLRALHAPAWIAWTILIPFLFGLQLGTESSLSAAVLACALLALHGFLERPDWATGFGFNVLASFAVLSRLDSIFVIACLWIAALLWCVQQKDRRGSPRRLLALRVHLAFIPLYAALWGAYLASNLVWFHILMPISGLLKSVNGHDHLLGHNLPHTALLSLAISSVSLAILWRRQRDRWLLFAELPFFLGVLMHAAYIALRMTSETRWTWYYVSWALLAALTSARAAACIFRGPAPDRTAHWAERANMLRTVAIAAALLVSLLVWYKMGWRHSREQVAENTAIPAMRQALEADHVQRILAYDQPGGMAYFTRLSVVPLDGLMADRQFQTELAQHGIADFIRQDNMDGFAGPDVPLDDGGRQTYCGKLFLESTRYTCGPWPPAADGSAQWMITGVEVYSRLPLAPAGFISLSPSNIVWTRQHYLTVWKINAGDASRSVPTVH